MQKDEDSVLSSGIGRIFLADHPDVLPIRLDGATPLTLETVRAVNELCDRAEDAAAAGPILLRLGGAAPIPATASLSVVNKWERALRRLERLDRPIIAAVAGAGEDADCGGVALDALLVADFRIATPAVRLIAPSGPTGVWPGMACYRLANGFGAAVRRTVLFGEPITAPAARAAHLFDEITDDPDATLAERWDSLAAAGAGLAVRRQLMFDASTTSFEEALGRHLAACDRVLRLSAAGAEHASAGAAR